MLGGRERPRAGPAGVAQQLRERCAPLTGMLAGSRFFGGLGHVGEHAAYGFDLERNLVDTLTAKVGKEARAVPLIKAQKGRSQEHSRFADLQAGLDS